MIWPITAVGLVWLWEMLGLLFKASQTEEVHRADFGLRHNSMPTLHLPELLSANVLCDGQLISGRFIRVVMAWNTG